MKSDVESATEMARLARRSSEIREGSITSSMGQLPGPSGSLVRKRSRRRQLSRKGTIQRKVTCKTLLYLKSLKIALN